VILHPFLAATDPRLRGRTGVDAGRAAGRRALAASARSSGAGDLRFEQDASGGPRPDAGWHWSTANTSGLAAAVVAPRPVGIDVERADRPRLEAAREALGPELAALGRNDAEALLSLWTAKEAVLKCRRVGLAGLPRCRLLEALPGRLRLRYDRSDFDVLTLVRGAHVLALACDAPNGFEASFLELHPVSP